MLTWNRWKTPIMPYSIVWIYVCQKTVFLVNILISYLKYALAFNKFRCQTLEMELKKSPVESGMKYQFHESKIFCQNFVVNDLMLSLNVSNEKTSSCWKHLFYPSIRAVNEWRGKEKIRWKSWGRKRRFSCQNWITFCGKHCRSFGWINHFLNDKWSKCI